MNPDEFNELVLNNIERHAWHVTLVSKREDEKEHNIPGWGYSVGLYHNFHHPEVVIFGLPHDLTHRIINAVSEDVRAGKIYKSGTNILKFSKAYFALSGP